MKCTQLMAIGVLAAGACWCSVMASESSPYRSGDQQGGPQDSRGRENSYRQLRTLFGQRTGLYGDPFFPTYSILSAIAPLAFVGGLTALVAHAFGLIGESSTGASNPNVTTAAPATPVSDTDAPTESLQQAEDSLSALAQDELRRRLEKIKIKGGYAGSKAHGLKVNRREYGTTYRPKSTYSSHSGSKSHVSYSSSNGNRYEYDYSGSRRYFPDHRKDE